MKILCVFAFLAVSVISNEEFKRERNFSIFDVSTEELKEDVVVGDIDFNKEIGRIKEIQGKAKRVACLAIIHNSLEKKFSKTSKYIKQTGKKIDEVVEEMTKRCVGKITEKLTNTILTPEMITSVNDKKGKYANLILPKAENSPTNTEKKKEEKQSAPDENKLAVDKNFILNHFYVIAFFLVMIVLLLGVMRYMKVRSEEKETKKKK